MLTKLQNTYLSHKNFSAITIIKENKQQKFGDNFIFLSTIQTYYAESDLFEENANDGHDLTADLRPQMMKQKKIYKENGLNFCGRIWRHLRNHSLSYFICN